MPADEVTCVTVQFPDILSSADTLLCSARKEVHALQATDRSVVTPHLKSQIPFPLNTDNDKGQMDVWSSMAFLAS